MWRSRPGFHFTKNSGEFNSEWRVYPDREKHSYQSDRCYCCSGNLKKILRMWSRKNGPKTCWQKSERYFGTTSESAIQLWRLYELLCQNRALISWNCPMQLNLPALHVTNRFHWYKSLESPWWKPTPFRI